MIIDSITTMLATTLCLLLAATAKALNVKPRHCGGTVRHVHLAVGHDPSTEMIVSFASIPSKYQQPIAGVLVGTSPSLEDAFVHMELEPASSYNLTVPWKWANYDTDTYYSPHYHHITVTGLQPSTNYYYKPIAHSRLREFSKYNLRHGGKGSLADGSVMDEREDLEEEEEFGRRQLGLAPYDGSEKDCPSPDKIRSFRTAPAPATPGDDSTISPISIAVIGDLGQFPHSQETVSHLVKRVTRVNDIDSLLLCGDLSYSQTDPRRWDTFFDFFDDYFIAESLPIQIVPGNHDIEKLENGQDIFLAYEHRFRMPRVKPAKLGVYDGPPGGLDMDTPPYPLPYEWGNAYYSYTYGPCRFIMLSSYSSVEPKSEQYNWILQELTSIDRSVTPWVVAVLHTPLYNTFSLHHRDLQIIAAKENLEPLFVEHKVNMVFSGHIHAYLRTTNVANGVVHPTGPVHITVGAGGRKCEAPFENEEPEPWVRVRDATMFGYGIFKIKNRTHAQWDWIHTGFADDHQANQLYHSNKTLPSGPAHDNVVIENQYFK